MSLFDYREDLEATVDTFEILDQQRGDSPGDFEVPPGAGMITGLDLFVAPDMAADAIVRIASIFRLQGNGLDSPHKPFYFLGPAGGSWQTTDGMHAAKSVPAHYSVAIPVLEGQSWQGAVEYIGETIGEAHGLMRVEYDGRPGDPAIIAADVREADLASATEALVPINTDPDGTTSNFLVPNVGTIAAIAMVVGMDVASVTRFAHQLELDGDGLALNLKPQRWCGWAGFQEVDSAGGETMLEPPEFIFPDYPVIAGRRVIARAGMIEDDYGAGTLAVGLLYV